MRDAHPFALTFLPIYAIISLTMKDYISFFLLALPLFASASTYTLDLSSATPADASAPILRHSSRPMDGLSDVRPALQVGDNIHLTLFPDTSFALEIVSAPPPGIAGQSFIARDPSSGASAVVKVTKSGIRIAIDNFMRSLQYTVRCKDGLIDIFERDNSQVDPGECGTCQGSVDTPIIEPAETTSSTPATRRLLGTSGNEFPTASQKSVVDILVAFDQGAKAKCTQLGFDGIDDFADYAVNKMNTVLLNSQLDDQFCYRLVGVVEIDGSWTAINNALLLSMRAREGKFANLDQLRDKYGADTITLLINRTSGNTSGIGFEYSDNAGKTLEYFEHMKYGCNVCDINTVYSRYTMSHETGHNMGCGHSNRQGSNSGPGRFPDSCGYHFTDATNVRRSTIMAYTYAGDDSYYYDPVPYFSTPEITFYADNDTVGCPLGVENVNNNCGTLLQTHADIASLREHVLPYDWDVKFLDNNGKEIPNDAYFYLSCDVTLTHSNPNAEIYYTTDGSTPTSTSSHCNPGDTININLYSPKTLTACAVTNGVAISTRSITLRDGLTWSGDENGNGVWASNDGSAKPWSGKYFGGDPVVFPDLAGIASATVTVQDAVSPDSVSFRACETSYTFAKGSDSAQINLKDAAFVPSGNLTFNVPVKMDALVFTNQTGTALTFNAPFGQTLDATSGYCTNMVGIGPYATLTVAPGTGKTQNFNKLNNIGWYAGNSTFRVGEGTVVFNGAINDGAGVTGRTKLEVGNGGSLIFNQGGATGYDMNETSLTIEKGGSVTFNQMEHMKRTVYLSGGTIYAKRLDLMSNPGVYVTDNSSIENNNGGYILCRDSDSEINVSAGKTLTLNVGTQTDNRSDTSDWGIVKKGGGTIVANAELKHSGVTQIDEGTLEVGYSSGSTVYGMKWIVASNSTLRVKSGCTLKVPALELDPTSTLSIPAATSAPLVVNGDVDLTEVHIALSDVSDLSLNASYPLISSTGEISGLKSFVRENWPQPATGLGWKVVLSDGTLTASIVNIVDADPYVNFMTNIAGLLPSIPDDATMTADGGLQIASSPIVIDGLATNAVSVTLDVTIGEPAAAERTICSWVVNGNLVRCVVTNGVLDCFWGSNSHVKNDADFLSLSPGRHTINVGYKSLDDNTYGGTFVYADGTLAYRAAGLRWSGKSVSKFTVGATAAETPDKPYTGLVIHNFALLNESSSVPLPKMTSSGGTVTYDYFAGKPPCVFAIVPDGAFETYGAILSGDFSGQYDALSVSVVASFPENATGTIVSSAVLDGYYPYSTQVEYRGDGTLAFRDNGSGSLIASVQVSADMSTEHLYTLTYKNGTGYKLYLDGVAVLANDGYYKGNNMPIINRVVFGCGYWTNWMTSFNDNPNPISNLKVYASHIALGTDDRTASETIVQDATGYEAPEEILPPTTPAVVDVLVAYDLGAQDYVANKNQTLEDFAQIQIDLMNDVLVTNELDRFYTYRLAGVCKVNKTYTDINTAPALIAAGEGPAVSLRAAREIYGADTVTLLVDTTGATIGNSSPLNSTYNVASQHECAFSVCSIRAVDTGKQHTMIHENAHNMGCGHARAQSVINSPFEYGRGYYFDDNGTTRHTIMAYGGDNDASWYFSTASGKSRFGLKLGDATNNNARVLRETCAYVAQWREAGADNIDVSVAGGSATWQTGKKYPWYVDGDSYVRSNNCTDYTYPCTTPLKATIVGPKRLTFKHKSYFGGTDVSENDYSHFDVLLDDSPVIAQNECNTDWTEAYVDVPEGEHEVVFVFSLRFAMNNPLDNKDGTAADDDAVWLKEFTLEDVECPHTSSSPNVTWTFPDDATLTDGNLHGILINSKGIVNSLDFGSTNAVCASVLAELPADKTGVIIGCKVTRDTDTFHVFAYSNGDGTFSLGYDDITNRAKSETIADWNAPHVWTFVFEAQGGVWLYCDGKLVTSDTGIKWNNSAISGPVTFGYDNRNKYPLVGMKIYAAHTDFGVGDAVRTSRRLNDSANQTMQSLGVLADFADESLDTQLALINVYNELGYIPSKDNQATKCVLRISEIMPKPTDDQNPGQREGMDVNGLESGWVEVENTSADEWADLADYRFTRTNRGKKSGQADYGNFPSRLVAPHGRAIFYTSERYSNSKSQKDSAFASGTFNGKPEIFEDYGDILVWGDKVNPKKSPFVRLYYMPDATTTNVVDTVVIPSDLPEGWSIIVGNAEDGEGTRRWMCPTPTRGTANTATDSLKRIGPNVGPLYEISSLKKTDVENEFALPVPPAKPGENYTITLPINPVMNPDGTFSPRTKDKIESIKLVYRKDLDDTTLTTNVVSMTKATDKKAWGDQYTATIPSSFFPAAGHLIQWKVLITDGEGVEWTSPSFNNPDDGYEWYGTIVEAPELESATLPTWHMFAAEPHLTQMDKDKDDQNKSAVPNYARIAIYDSSTSNYYDYVRIDLRGNTSAGFTKKGHGLRFAKAHPLTMTDIVSGQEIEGIRKTSLISEYADPSYMRQMIAFWLWNKMGNKVPFDFPVRCNLNGEFYQLAFNSERFTDELIEDVYKLDKYGYSYKNVGTLKSGTNTTAGNIEKKTPDDEDESNITVLQNELRAKITAAQAVSSSPDGGNTGLDNAALTKFVVEKFDLPAWINYLASARITQEMDDVWANVCAYYDNAEMKEGVRGTDTWMPLGYDFNLSFGQYYYNDIKNYGNNRDGLMANQDWFKSHPFYGGNRVKAYRNSSMVGEMDGNDGFESVLQSSKFRRLFLRRLRTLMDQELKEPGTAEADTPFMAKMREMAELMRADAALDKDCWPNNNTDDAIDVWTTRPKDMDAGIDEIWSDYVVPRREHLYVTHSITNTAKTIGYGSNLNAGIPEAQSPMDVLAPKIVLDLSGKDLGYIAVSNLNDEVVDMSGWKLKFGVEWAIPPGTVCDANDCIYIVRDRREFITNPPVDLTDQVIIGNASFDDIIANVFLNSADNEPLKGLSSEEGAVVFDAKNQAAADEAVADIAPTLTQDQQNDGLDVQYLKVEAQPTATKGKYQAVVVLNPETVAPPEVETNLSKPVEIEDTANPNEQTVSITVSNAIKGLWYGYAVTDDLSTAFVDDASSFQQAGDNTSLKITGSSRDKSKESEFFLIKVMLTQPPTE